MDFRANPNHKSTSKDKDKARAPATHNKQEMDVLSLLNLSKIKSKFKLEASDFLNASLKKSEKISPPSFAKMTGKMAEHWEIIQSDAGINSPLNSNPILSSSNSSNDSSDHSKEEESFIEKKATLSSHMTLVYSQEEKDQNPKVEVKPETTPKKETLAASAAKIQAESHSSFIPSLFELTQEIEREIENNPHSLLSLNPSRRQGLAQYLHEIADHPPQSLIDQNSLKSWISFPTTQRQKEALTQFRLEVALNYICQAVVLKVWSDKELRKFIENDLKNINWSLSNVLKPYVPANRENWHITRPNLYSWYNPSIALQERIWQTLNQWNTNEETPLTLVSFVRYCLAQKKDFSTFKQSYDVHFLKGLWETSSLFGLDPYEQPDAPIARKRVFFTPTLRQGLLPLTGPKLGEWIGTEKSLFNVLLAEVLTLWANGPSAPPLWSVSFGVDAHTREQLSMDWNNPRPSTLSQIADMEACDMGFILEEKCVRSNQKTSEAKSFKSLLEKLNYFKKMKSSDTSLGALQACVTLAKLRSSGLLWWARDERLGHHEGTEVVRYLFEKGKLIAEWDFSELAHDLPTAEIALPKYLYLFQKDPNTESRRLHHPRLIHVSGTLRSYVEVSPLLNRSINTYFQESSNQKGIVVRDSATAQIDWLECWPDQKCFTSLAHIEALQSRSVPLGQVATIRYIPPESPKSKSKGLPHSLRAKNTILLQAYSGTSSLHPEDTLSNRHLRVITLHDTSQYSPKEEAILVVCENEQWMSLLTMYFTAPLIEEWLDLYCDRKKDKWVLKDSIIKCTPITQSLTQSITEYNEGNTQCGQFVLPTEDEILHAPQEWLNQLKQFNQERDPEQPDQSHLTRASVLLRASLARTTLLKSQKTLFSIFSFNQSTIQWSNLLSSLGPDEKLPFVQSQSLKIIGTIAPHVPIDRIQKISGPIHTILFSTQSGFNLQIRCEDSFIFEILWEQVKQLEQHTWTEISENVMLPRSVEKLKATTNELMKAHFEETTRLKQIQSIIKNCFPV